MLRAPTPSTSPSTPTCRRRRRWHAASAEALDGAGVGIDDVAHLDLYSCFASSVHLARDALGIAADDRRALTVTGGLPYYGGAGSNYLTHAIATMADVLRDDPGSLGLVTGVGMHMTKHVAGVYSTDAARAGRRPGAGADAAGRRRCRSSTTTTGRPRSRPTPSPTAATAAPEWGLVSATSPAAARLRPGRGRRPARCAGGRGVGGPHGHARAPTAT